MITVPTGQFLNWSEENEYGVQLMWGSSYVYSEVDEETQEEGYYLGTELDDRAEEIQFAFSFNEEELMELNLLNCDGDVTLEFPFNYEATGLYGMWSDDQSWASALEFVTEGQTYAQEFIAKPAVPANPTADEWYDGNNEGGYSRFYYTLPTTDIDGKPLDAEALSYSIYTDDDQLFTFPYENYYYDFDDFGITEGITEIPYEMYANGYDFHTGYTYFYRTNAEGYDPFFTWRIGIQVHYTVNGETNSSDIVYLEVFPRPTDSVNELNAGKTVANVRYFNVAGQEMAQPEGMTIAVTTYTDGTTSAVKVVK